MLDFSANLMQFDLNKIHNLMNITSLLVNTNKCTIGIIVIFNNQVCQIDLKKGKPYCPFLEHRGGIDWL